MTKSEKATFEELARLVANKAQFVHPVPEEEFYRLVFKLNPGSEVMMRYEGSLFDLAKSGHLDPADYAW